VVAFSGGSFRVHFEAKGIADLFGGSIIGEAMKRVDDLMRLAQLPPDEMTRGFERHKGAELAAYRDFLRLVEDKDIPVSYQWAEPAQASAPAERISPDAARAIVALLDERKTSDPFAFSGRFTAVNVDREPFSWSAMTAQGKHEHGLVHEDAGTALSGV